MPGHSYLGIMLNKMWMDYIGHPKEIKRISLSPGRLGGLEIALIPRITIWNHINRAYPLILLEIIENTWFVHVTPANKIISCLLFEESDITFIFKTRIRR